MKMKTFSMLLLTSLFCVSAYSQSTVNTKKYKIIIQLTNGDTSVHKVIIRQINNALIEAPNSKIEIVCHSAGITMLQSSKTVMAAQIKDLRNKGVIFAACANTIRERNIDKADILSEAIIVPAGIIEVVDKESKGWSYLKAGN